MTFELQMLIAAAGILFVLLAFQGALVPVNQGFGWGLGSRDVAQEKSALQGRATRTIANHMESMALFVPLVLAAHLAGVSTPLTIWGAGVYVASRAIFAGVYLMGVPFLRSAVWGVSVVGLLMIAYPLTQAMV